MTGAVITAWSAISACGIGADAHRAVYGDPARRPRLTPVGDPVPGEAHVAADFDVTEALGPKGTSSMDRCSALAVATAADLLAAGQRPQGHIGCIQRNQSAPGDSAPPSGIGVVLGTTSGSAQTQLDFTRESLTRAKPYRVNPALMPFALMNSAAARTAMWHGLTGPNTTIAGGRMSGLSTLRYGARLLATGRADTMLCGAVEEYGPARQWLADQRTPDAPHPLGEGGAILRLEPAAAHGETTATFGETTGTGPPALADVLGIDTRVVVDDDPAAALEACIRRTLDRAGAAASDVRTVAVSAPPGPLADAERRAVARTAGHADVRDPGDIVGDTGAATGPFQVTLVLERRGLALMTAADEDGTVGCGLLRVH